MLRSGLFSGVLFIALAACPSASRVAAFDAGSPLPGAVRDAGLDAGSPASSDGGFLWTRNFAGEACPDEAFEAVDASIQFGLCAVLTTLSGQALLNGALAQGPVKIQFVAGHYGSEVDRPVDSLGAFSTKVLRGQYDILRYQPSGVFPTFLGFRDLGAADMRVNQKRDFITSVHSIRGTAQFAGLPFAGTNSPNDIFLTGYGTPLVQTVSTMSEHGAFEVRLIDGEVALTLDTPATALLGTDLLGYRITSGALALDRDLFIDIAIAARQIEGELTIDGSPFPDRRSGPDYNLEFVKPGDGEPSVRTHHEGGAASFSGLVPQGRYGVNVGFERVPDRSLPSGVFNQQVAPVVDLSSSDARVSKNFTTWRVEGGLLIDGRPLRPNPNSTWKLFMYGFAGATNTQSGLLYDVPMDASSFTLRIFEGNYFTVLGIDERFADDLAEGFYIIDRYLEVHANRSLAVNIETSVLTGTLLIDGSAPIAGKIAGDLWFRNRALEGQNSWFRKRVVTAQDGEFRARLPKGEYEVYFFINRNTYPAYATGRQLLAARVVLDGPVTQELVYDTVLVTGPIRLDSALVPDAVPGDEVGVVLRSEDGREFAWGFSGGAANYQLRVPKGEFDVDFVVNLNALEGVAWGTAPFGRKLNTAAPLQTAR